MPHILSSLHKSRSTSPSLDCASKPTKRSRGKEQGVEWEGSNWFSVQSHTINDYLQLSTSPDTDRDALWAFEPMLDSLVFLHFKSEFTWPRLQIIAFITIHVTNTTLVYQKPHPRLITASPSC